MQYLFMNERIRDYEPDGPVVVAMDDLVGGEMRTREADEFELWVHGIKIGRVVYDAKTLKVCETHAVKAWVELDDLVIVRRAADAAVSAPVAKAKRAGRKVTVATKPWE
jgi:hypothetical protein